jgi:energy-converting hydrogenase B subunit D
MTSFNALQCVLFGLVGLTGTAVVLTRNPKRQIFVAGVYGLFQALLFYLLHSPDVALSELAVTTVGLPILVLLTLAKLEKVK